MLQDPAAPTERAHPAPASPSGASEQGQPLPHDQREWSFDTRHYRVRGLSHNLSPQQLRVTILARRDELLHADTLDLYQARARSNFVRTVASELYTDEALIKRDVLQLLLYLEELQQDQIQRATVVEPVPEPPSGAEREAALQLLHDPQLTSRILADYEACGLVGEETNKLACYLACVSRWLPQPLAILIQSSSAAGKTSLMDATLAFVPDEHQVRYSAMTGQSLYYMGQHDLQHKILAVAEEEGVAQASYALKLLQSDGRLRIAAAGKDQGSGRQKTLSYEVRGPVMMLLTTTQESPDSELQNRCLTLRVNESSEQTAAIQARQRLAYTLGGHQRDEQRMRTIARHQNAQRLLQPLPVLFPWAEQLRFRHDQTHMRRDHAKYLSLIAASAVLHQYQRSRLTVEVGESCQPAEYVQANLDDVQLANRLASDILGQSLDALLPQTRQLLQLTFDFVRQRAAELKQPPRAVRFTQRELREALDWSEFTLRRHLQRLVALEYVLAYRTGRGNQRQYELLYEGHDFPFLPEHVPGTRLDSVDRSLPAGHANAGLFTAHRRGLGWQPPAVPRLVSASRRGVCH